MGEADEGTKPAFAISGFASSSVTSIVPSGQTAIVQPVMVMTVEVPPEDLSVSLSSFGGRVDDWAPQPVFAATRGPPRSNVLFREASGEHLGRPAPDDGVLSPKLEARSSMQADRRGPLASGTSVGKVPLQAGTPNETHRSPQHAKKSRLTWHIQYEKSRSQRDASLDASVRAASSLPV